MDKLIDLIRQKSDAEKRIEELMKEISEVKDGYKYKAFISKWTLTETQVFNNWFACHLAVKDFNGDNGIVNVYTNNQALVDDNINNNYQYYRYTDNPDNIEATF